MLRATSYSYNVSLATSSIAYVCSVISIAVDLNILKLHQSAELYIEELFV